MIARFIYRVRETLRIAFARLRVHLYRWQGADVHPKCLLGRGTRLEHPWTVHLGARCMLQPDVWLNVGDPDACLRIGEYTFIGRGTEIEVSRRVTIGKGALIAPGVFITDHNHALKLGAPMFQQRGEEAEVVIGDDVWIGGGAVICPGVTIGSGAVIGAGSVVINDIPAGVVAAGNPCRIIRYITPGS